MGSMHGNKVHKGYPRTAESGGIGTTVYSAKHSCYDLIDLPEAYYLILLVLLDLELLWFFPPSSQGVGYGSCMGSGSFLYEFMLSGWKCII